MAHVIRGPVSLLKWVFYRKEQMLTCEISVNGADSYDVCVVLHWDAGSSVIESFDHAEAAIQRHEELAWYFREAGWARVGETPGGHIAAA